jgi:tRNA threonylcarbamoyl adenosine modification protein YjeE
LTASTLLFDSIIETTEEMINLGESVSKVLTTGDLVLLIGPLGAGKTTLTRGVGKGLKAIGNVSSPTFVIARTHKCENSDTPLVHVDAYRLGSPSELDDLDIPFREAIVLVEWGKGLTDGIADNWLEIEIARDTTGVSETRTIRITGFGPRWEQVKI